MSALADARRARAASNEDGVRLNAFGEPFRGRKIRGVGAVERARGKAYGSLSGSQREAYGSQAAFGADLEAQAMSQSMQEAQARGEARARQAMAPVAPVQQEPPAPAEGAKTAGRGWWGSMVKTGKDALMAAARRQRAMDAAGSRARARARFEQEQRGYQPESYTPFDFAA